MFRGTRNRYWTLQMKIPFLLPGAHDLRVPTMDSFQFHTLSRSFQLQETESAADTTAVRNTESIYC